MQNNNQISSSMWISFKEHFIDEKTAHYYQGLNIKEKDCECESCEECDEREWEASDQDYEYTK
jgi:hypothetical protein